jgi:hypothetical protein
MFGSLIKFVAETTGQIVGEVAHQIGEVATAITEIPDAFTTGYEKELFNTKPDSDEETPPNAN